MAQTVEELTVNFTDDSDQLVCKELDKVILSKGAWATIMYKFVNFDRAKGDYGPPKIAIRRYKKFNGEYKAQNKFNISSLKQAQQIVETLQNWISEMGKDEE